jgi:hypothetical protein
LRRVAAIDPQITYTLVGALITGGGWLGRELWKSWQEARQGRKDEAQKIAAERDEWKRKAAENKALAETYYNNKLRVKDVLYATRRVAMEKGNLAPEELPPLPPDHH